MKCQNPLAHEAHLYLADSESVALSRCEGSGIGEEEEAGRRHAEETRFILRGLKRSLAEVKRQREASLDGPTQTASYHRTQGQIDGLAIAIAAIERRLSSGRNPFPGSG
jgi:hypothetical protein